MINIIFLNITFQLVNISAFIAVFDLLIVNVTISKNAKTFFVISNITVKPVNSPVFLTLIDILKIF